MSDCFDFKQNPLPPIELGIWNRGTVLLRQAGTTVLLLPDRSTGNTRISWSPDNSPRLSMGKLAAAEHIEQTRIERERHIEASHERAEPLRELEGADFIAVETSATTPPPYPKKNRPGKRKAPTRTSRRASWPPGKVRSSAR